MRDNLEGEIDQDTGDKSETNLCQTDKLKLEYARCTFLVPIVFGVTDCHFLVCFPD